MKKNILFLSSLFASSFVFATSYVYDGSNYLKIKQPVNDDVVLALDANGTVNDNGRARFLFDENTVHSIKTDATNINASTFTYWDILGKSIKVDINSSSNDAVAMTSSQETYLRGYDVTQMPDGLGEVVIKNTATVEEGKNPYALLNFSTLFLKYATKLVLDTNTRLTAKTIKLDDPCGIHIKSGTTEWNVDSVVWNGSKAFLKVSEGATLKKTSSTSLTLATATIEGSLINETTNDILLKATKSYCTNISGDFFTKGRIKIYGTAEFSGSVQYISASAKNILLTQEKNLDNSIRTIANLTLSGKNVLSALVASSESEYNSAKDKSQFVVREENDKNVYYKKDYAEFVINGESNAITININADNAFKLYFSNGNALTLNFNNDATFVVAGITVYGCTPVVTINNFENDSMFFLDSVVYGYDSITDFKAIASTGEEYNKDDLKLVAGTYNGQAGYWLTVPALAVPEPAEWAMILGGLALGFAIYRRRK